MWFRLFNMFTDTQPPRILYDICPIKSTDGPNGPSVIYWTASTAIKKPPKTQVVGD